MKRRGIFFTGLLGMFVPSAAQATDWQFVTISASESIYYIDVDSIKDQSTVYGSVKTAWFKTDDSRNKSVIYREEKLFYHFKCANSEMKMVQFIEYSADGTVLDSGGSQYNSFRVAAPDTVGYSLLEVACKSR